MIICSYFSQGAQWLSGRVHDSRPKGRGFEPHWRHCRVSLSKNINPSLVLVQPRKTRPFITERLLMGRKESNQTKNKILFQPVDSFRGTDKPLFWVYKQLRFLSTLWPILQDIAHHIQDKVAISFDLSSIGLISYKWFLTIYDKYSSVKTYNEEDAIF